MHRQAEVRRTHGLRLAMARSHSAASTCTPRSVSRLLTTVGRATLSISVCIRLFRSSALAPRWPLSLQRQEVWSSCISHANRNASGVPGQKNVECRMQNAECTECRSAETCGDWSRGIRENAGGRVRPLGVNSRGMARVGGNTENTGGTGSADTAEPPEKSGCGCAVVKNNGSPLGKMLLTFMAAALVVFRRRRTMK